MLLFIGVRTSGKPTDGLRSCGKHSRPTELAGFRIAY